MILKNQPLLVYLFKNISKVPIKTEIYCLKQRFSTAGTRPLTRDLEAFLPGLEILLKLYTVFTNFTLKKTWIVQFNQ